MKRKLISNAYQLLLSFGLLLVVGIAQAQPVARCKNAVAYLSFTGTVQVLPSSIDDGSTGAHLLLINQQSQVDFTCADLGVRTVSLTAVDTITGQSVSCTAQVTVVDMIAPQAVCASNINISLDSFGNASLQAWQLDPNASSYDACGISSYSVNGATSISFNCSDTGTTVLTLLLADASGNTSTCSSNIHVFDSGICSNGSLQASVDSIVESRCDTLACTGQAFLTVTGGWSPYQFLWSDGLTSTSLVRNGLCGGFYTVTVYDAVGSSVSLGPIAVETSPGCVWPGDTDNNGEDNNFDLLAIALAYGQSGLVRPNASTLWQGEGSPDWNIATTILDLPDFKHIDANGDGLIDSLDLAVVAQNYNESYFPVRPVVLSPLGPIPFYADTMQVDEGQRVSIPINLGTLALPADSVYALAFSIVFDSFMVDAGTVSVDFSGSWLGNDLLTLYKDFSQSGRVEIALGRKDQQKVSGAGHILTVNFTIRDDIFRNPGMRNFPLFLQDIRLIDNKNKLQGVEPIDGVVVVNEISAVQHFGHPQLKIYPNPATGQFVVELSNASARLLRMYSASGQLVKEVANLNMLLNPIAVNDLPAGIYFVQVFTDKGVLQERIQIR